MKARVRLHEVFKPAPEGVYKEGSEEYTLAFHNLCVTMAKESRRSYEMCQKYLLTYTELLAGALAKGNTIEVAGIGRMWLIDEYKWQTVNKKAPLILREVEIKFNPSSKLEDVFLSMAERMIDQDVLREIKHNKRYRRDLNRRKPDRFRLVLRCIGQVYEDRDREK
jgi:hypothetical protein